MSLYLGTSPIANTGYNKANTDLSNLTSTGKNIANWSNNVTNCITEIPQDIKLELSSGVLTLKAGSKVYVPNGAGVFDVVTIASDMTMNGGSANGTELVYLTANGASVYHYLDNSSGTDWTATSQYQCRYNTTDNMIKNTNNTGSTWLSQLSFPIAKVTLSSGTVTSIDQVFNGFGYIGSTVFALPGVKGLIPDGRNEDGTLKNIEITTSSVITRTVTGVQNTHEFTLLQSAIGINDHIYNNEENYLYNISGQLQTNRFVAGKVDFSSTSPYKVTSFTPKTAFHALDYNDSSTISGWSMPSSRYIDLTLGASGATYTAPANGYFYFAKISNASNQYMTIFTNNEGTPIFATTNAQPIKSGQARCFLPVKKGDVVGVSYNLGGTTSRFCFVFAEGE